MVHPFTEQRHTLARLFIEWLEHFTHLAFLKIGCRWFSKTAFNTEALSETNAITSSASTSKSLWITCRTHFANATCSTPKFGPANGEQIQCETSAYTLNTFTGNVDRIYDKDAAIAANHHIGNGRASVGGPFISPNPYLHSLDMVAYCGNLHFMSLQRCHVYLSFCWYHSCR